METCYKAFRREVIQSITIEEDRFGFEPEVTAKIARGEWRIYEVGISYDGRTYAEGKKIGWRDGFRALVLHRPLLPRRPSLAAVAGARPTMSVTLPGGGTVGAPELTAEIAATAAPATARNHAWDGLRGVAVAGVLAYHLGWSALPGGFLGVSAFFTLSGFLITSLLLAELQRSDTIARGAFWARRVRRLLRPPSPPCCWRWRSGVGPPMPTSWRR